MVERSSTFSPISITRESGISRLSEGRNLGSQRPRGESPEQSCVIRFKDGKMMRLEGRDVPSTAAVLLLFKSRKLKALQERNATPLARRERMARDFFNRFGKRGVSANTTIKSAPLHWWERGGTIRS
jgi:hypothetical protein